MATADSGGVAPTVAPPRWLLRTAQATRKPVPITDRNCLGPLLHVLAGPLQLPREKPRVVVRLQAVTACQDVHCHLSRREPEATVRHRGQTNADAPRSTRQVIFRLNSRGQHQLLAELFAGLLLLLLLFLLLLKTSHATKHRLEERRQGFHHLALIPRDVEINGECLLESYLETLHDGLVFCLQGSAGVEPFLFVTAVCWRAWCLCYSVAHQQTPTEAPLEPQLPLRERTSGNGSRHCNGCSPERRRWSCS